MYKMERSGHLGSSDWLTVTSHVIPVACSKSGFPVGSLATVEDALYLSSLHPSAALFINKPIITPQSFSNSVQNGNCVRRHTVIIPHCITESLAFGPITAIVSPPRFNGKVLSLFISSVIDLRAMSSARESCPAEATTEKGMPVQDTFSGSSISPKAKRAVKRRLTATSTAFSSIFPCFTASTRAS